MSMHWPAAAGVLLRSAGRVMCAGYIHLNIFRDQLGPSLGWVAGGGWLGIRTG